MYLTARLKDSSVDCVMQMRRDMTMKKNKVSSLRGEARHCRHRIFRTYGKDGQRTRAEMNREKKTKACSRKNRWARTQKALFISPIPRAFVLGTRKG
jgi:hypothetical protein